MTYIIEFKKEQMLNLIPSKSQFLIGALLIISPMLVPAAMDHSEKFMQFCDKLIDKIGNACSSAYSTVADLITRLIHSTETKARSMYSKMPHACHMIIAAAISLSLGQPLLTFLAYTTPNLIFEIISSTQKPPVQIDKTLSLSDIPAIAAASLTTFYFGYIKRNFMFTLLSTKLIYAANQNHEHKHYTRTLIHSGLALLGMRLMHSPSMIVPALLAVALDFKENIDPNSENTNACIDSVENTLNSIFQPAR